MIFEAMGEYGKTKSGNTAHYILLDEASCADRDDRQTFRVNATIEISLRSTNMSLAACGPKFWNVVILETAVGWIL